jgi:putative FmdB family regulatory protein
MPIYEFKCLNCEKEFEKILPSTHENQKCPDCNSKTEQMISRFSGIVKGSPHRSIDSLVGEDSEKKWAKYKEKKEKRKKESTGGK